MQTVVALLTVLYILEQFSTASWFHDALPQSVVSVFSIVAICARLVFIVLTGYTLCQVILDRERREVWLGLLAALLISVGQFAGELSTLGIPGIWFPFGTGVSRTQYAFALFDLVLFLLLLDKFLFFARNYQSSQTNHQAVPHRVMALQSNKSQQSKSRNFTV